MQILTRRTGVEVELLAPAGHDRLTLATAIAQARGGTVRRTSHTDSEPSLVPGMGHFWHLTPGFTVHDGDGALVATLVDDITLVADLAREREQGTPPRPAPQDWYRLLSDEPRLLRLVDDHCDPAAPLSEVLGAVAVLFGVDVETVGPVRRLQDRSGATIALAAPLPPGRERPCEIVTPPLVRDHERALEDLLAPARDLGFTIPSEAAVHLHVDAAPFRGAAAFANLVRLFGHWREVLRTALGTNPACTRLQPLPAALLDLVDPADGGGSGPLSDWPRLQAAARGTGLTKYYDVNLTALLTETPARDTVEVRILPGALHAGAITARAALLERLLDRCCDPRPLPRPSAGQRAVSTSGHAVRLLHELASGGAGSEHTRAPQREPPLGAPGPRAESPRRRRR